MHIPDIVRTKAHIAGAADWLDELPYLVERLASRWSFTLESVLEGGTESFVAAVNLDGRGPAVLKIAVPNDGAAANEIIALRLADGDGCAGLLQADVESGAMLLERLGPMMSSLSIPLDRRHELLVDAVRRMWRPAPDSGLPTGAAKARWLIDFITAKWEQLDHPCSERAVAYAIGCAERRIAAHDEERAVLVHGDVHQWNALQAGDRFKLVDPDGLLAEAEYDLGIIMREDPAELMQSDPWQRAQRLAGLSGRDVTAIWEWGVVERVSTGLLCTQIELHPAGRLMLEAADLVAR